MLLMWVSHQSNLEKLHEKYGITYGIRKTETPTLSGTYSITKAIQKKVKNKMQDLADKSINENSLIAEPLQKIQN